MEQRLFGRTMNIIVNQLNDFNSRYNYRSISDEELTKIKDRIDQKIARRQQQAAKSATPSAPTTTTTLSDPTPSPALMMTTTMSNPTPPPATTYNVPAPVIDAPMPTYDKDEYSIFRDLPVSRPTTTTVSYLIYFICSESSYCLPLESKTTANVSTSTRLEYSIRSFNNVSTTTSNSN